MSIVNKKNDFQVIAKSAGQQFVFLKLLLKHTQVQ